MRASRINDPWEQTIALIAMLRGQQQETERFRRRQLVGYAQTRGRLRPTVVILECPTKTTATVYWRDSTCSYADQQWRRGRAGRAGQCAVTGEAIFVGDDVYRPKRGLGAPVNCEEMILAQTVTNSVEEDCEQRTRSVSPTEKSSFAYLDGEQLWTR
jgi:hypothetical protein